MMIKYDVKATISQPIMASTNLVNMKLNVRLGTTFDFDVDFLENSINVDDALLGDAAEESIAAGVKHKQHCKLTIDHNNNNQAHASLNIQIDNRLKR